MKGLRRTALPLIGALALAAGCAPSPDETAVDLVLLGGHVFDVASGETLRDRDVWILGERIVSITGCP